MFVLTIATASFEIVYGVRTNSNSLIADGLYSFAEGLCLIGVLVVLHYSRDRKHHDKRNTFGYERLELLFGLIQEVFLLSISLGIIVDAVNHLINPIHVHHPKVIIILGISGMFIGLLGIIMFWGYHHDHNIQEEIAEKKRREFLSWTKTHVKAKRKKSAGSRQNTIVEDPLMTEQQNDKVVLFESIIVVISGLMIHFIPHIDPNTGKEINTWLKYIDPSLTLIMVIVIAIHALPVIFSISKVLIENVPGGIDTQRLMNEIVTAIPAIKSIHSFHVWRATPKDIYATLHLACDEDVVISTCTNKYGKIIQKIFKSYCIRYFTLQFEYIPSSESDELLVYHCVHGLHRKRRGHTFDEPMTKLAKEAIVHIQ
ncbi:unnamed protein product [Rotaria sp. Silwood2]|nr:unnamed protein product [Rotaria sp. Silwood2]CAF4313677.1 unnamed protein product [Rotaria sp. Silwood2]